MASLSTLKSRIRKALREQNNYSKDMESAILLAAGNLFAYELALKDLEELDCTYVEEVSREGNIRLVPHPAFKVFKDASESVRRSLRELQLTLATLEGTTENDDLDILVESVNKVS
ncbi:MAG: hypothetical protein ACRC9P_02375 [Bacteroides sp.]